MESLGFLFYPLVIFFAIVVYSITLREARVYAKQLESFAKENNFKFRFPKDKMISQFYRILSFLDTSDLKVKSAEESTYKKSLFPSTINFYQFYNFIDGIYQKRKIQVYNYQFIENYNSNTSISSTYSEVFIKPVKDSLYIRPEKFRDKVESAIGLDDIELEYHDFNKKYRVKATNHAFAFQVLDPTLMEELMKHEKISIMISHDSLIVAQFEELQPGQILKNLELGIKIANQLDK